MREFARALDPQTPRKLLTVGAALVLFLALTSQLAAQAVNVPRASPAATVTQTVGLSQVTVEYHRPVVQDREVWGALVPYGQPWRAGANENTKITFSHDVKVEGKEVPAGTYGLHMIPTEDAWTVVLSRNSSSWGSFFYNPEEDALRVEVTPKEAPHRETLTYDFADLASDSATVVLAWEKMRVPFKVSVDTPSIVLASIRDELRTIPGFGWQGWNSAAAYCLQNDMNFEEALQWVEASLQREERFTNWQTKSQILAKLERKEESERAMETALARALPLELHGYGRQLVAQGKPGEALEIFELNAKRNPDVWFVHIGLARGLSAAGDLTRAAEAMRRGAEGAPEAQRAIYEGLASQLSEGKAL